MACLLSASAANRRGGAGVVRSDVVQQDAPSLAVFLYWSSPQDYVSPPSRSAVASPASYPLLVDAAPLPSPVLHQERQPVRSGFLTSHM